MSVYSDHSVINLLALDKLRNLNNENHMLMGRARRFRLPSPTNPSTTTEARDAIVDFTLPQSSSIELPTVAPSVYHKPYRYVYGMNKLDPKHHYTFADGLIKLDMSTSSSDAPAAKMWRKENHTPSEPIFVPRPGAVEEDDGVLLSVVLDEVEGRSSMVVVDAKEMKEVGRAEMEGVFPVGFHGVFSANAEKKEAHL